MLQKSLPDFNRCSRKEEAKVYFLVDYILIKRCLPAEKYRSGPPDEQNQDGVETLPEFK